MILIWFSLSHFTRLWEWSADSITGGGGQVATVYIGGTLKMREIQNRNKMNFLKRESKSKDFFSKAYLLKTFWYPEYFCSESFLTIQKLEMEKFFLSITGILVRFFFWFSNIRLEDLRGLIVPMLFFISPKIDFGMGGGKGEQPRNCGNGNYTSLDTKFRIEKFWQSQNFPFAIGRRANFIGLHIHWIATGIVEGNIARGEI